jgi:hypothetical protein
MELYEPNANTLILRPDLRARQSVEEGRRVFPWLVGGLILSLGLWLLLRLGGNWPIFSPGGAYAIVTGLVIYIVGGVCCFSMIFLFIQPWVSPLTTCELDKEAGLAKIAVQGIWRWQSAGRGITCSLQDLGAVVLKKEYEGPVWLGLQLPNKVVKLGSSSGDKSNLGAMITKVSRISLDPNHPLGAEASMPLSAIAGQVSHFLEIPLLIDLGAEERLIQIPQAFSADSHVIPLCCPRCGAPLPDIRPGMASLRCGYCDTNMQITSEAAV